MFYTMIQASGIDLARDEALLTTIRAQLPEESKEFISQVYMLIQGHPNADIERVVSNLSQVPQEERAAEFISQVQTLIQGHHNPDIGRVVYFLSQVPQGERTAEFISQVQLLIQGLPNADIGSVVYNLSQVPQGERAAVVQHIQGQIRANSDITQDAIITMLRERIQNLPVAEQVVEQEALTRQRATITQAYQSLVAKPEVAESIAAVTSLQPEALNEAFNKMAEDIRTWIDLHKNITDKEKFRFKTAARALQLMEGVEGIEHHSISSLASYRTYAYQGMPNIMQLYVILFQSIQKASPNPSPEDFVKIWLAENPSRVGRTHENIGAFIAANTEAIQKAALGVGGAEIEDLPMFQNTIKESGQIYMDLLYAYKTRINYMPIIEALFMTMRGHNDHLESEHEPNRPACAEGAYLNILKELPPVLGNTEAAQRLAGVEVVACAPGA